MDLTHLSRADLTALSKALAAIGGAMDTLQRVGLEAELSLTPRGTVLRAPALFDELGEAGDAVLVEPAGAAARDEAPAEIISAPAEAVLPAPAEKAAPPADCASPGGGGQVCGIDLPRRITDEDRGEIVRLYAAGAEVAGIAGRLGLRPEVVAGFVASQVRKGILAKRGEAAGFRPVGEIAAAMVAAAKQVPGGEPGGLQQHIRAENAPVQAEARADNPSVPASAEGPAPVVPAAEPAAAMPPRWTADEDQLLVRIVAQREVELGRSRAKAVAEAAAGLGRPVQGTLYRLRKLAAPLADEIARLRAERLDAAAQTTEDPLPADPAAKESAAGVGAPPPPPAQAPAAPMDADPEPAVPVAGREGAAAVTGQYAAARPVSVPVPVAAPSLQIARAVSEGAGTCPPDLHGEMRVIWLHLDALGYGRDGRSGTRWDAELDHELVELLSGGSKLGEAATEMGVDAGAAAARFRALSAPIRDDRDRVTIDGQKRLLSVLKARVLRQRRAGGVAA